EALRHVEPEAVDVSDKGMQRGEPRTGMLKTEFLGLLDDVDGVCAGTGKTYDLGAGRLRAQKERREICGVKRMLGGASDLAAERRDSLGRIAFEIIAKAVIGGQEKPACAGVSPGDHARSAVGERIGVVSPVRDVGRTGFAGDLDAGRSR